MKNIAPTQFSNRQVLSLSQVVIEAANTTHQWYDEPSEFPSRAIALTPDASYICDFAQNDKLAGEQLRLTPSNWMASSTVASDGTNQRAVA